MTENEKLVAEARTASAIASAAVQPELADLLRRLADALEASERERVARHEQAVRDYDTSYGIGSA